MGAIRRNICIIVTCTMAIYICPILICPRTTFVLYTSSVDLYDNCPIRRDVCAIKKMRHSCITYLVVQANLPRVF